MKLCPDCNHGNPNDVKYCNNCGHKFADSVKERERDLDNTNNAYCPKCKSQNIAKEGSGYVCNECGYEFSEPTTNPLRSFVTECRSRIERFVSFFKSVDSSNYKNKLLNARMAVRYVFMLVIISIILIAYNTGKNIVVNDEWMSRKSDYQTTIDEYNNAEKKLPKLRAEIVSNSDLVFEIRDFKRNKSKKESEIKSLEEKIADLAVEKSNLEDDIDNLEDEVKELKNEKEKLIGEIAKAKGKGYTLTAGKYVGGDDIPIGTYNINWISGNGNVIVGLHGSEVNEIFGSNSQYGYIKSYKNCDISYGTDIVISGNVKVQFKAKD